MRKRHGLGILRGARRELDQSHVVGSGPYLERVRAAQAGRGYTAEARIRALNRGAEEPADALVGDNQCRVHRAQHGGRLRVVFLEFP